MIKIDRISARLQKRHFGLAAGFDLEAKQGFFPIKRIIEEEADLAVVGEASDGLELLGLLNLMTHMGKAVDEVRKAESREMVKNDDERLKLIFPFSENCFTSQANQRLAFYAQMQSGYIFCRQVNVGVPHELGSRSIHIRPRSI